MSVPGVKVPTHAAPVSHAVHAHVSSRVDFGPTTMPQADVGAIAPPALDRRILLAFPLMLVGLMLMSSGQKGTGNVVFSVVGFMVCSSMMLIVNKLAITFFPFPSTLLALQLLSCAFGVRLAGLFGLAEVEGLAMKRVVAFGVVPFAFLATLLANIKVLEFANVETFIMVRNATPLLTSVLDWLFLGRELPNRSSTGALLMALMGSVIYVWADANFQVRAYSWAAVWLGIFLFDQVYIKHVISTVSMSGWTRVYYNNALAGIPALLCALDGDHAPQALVKGWRGDPTTGALVVAVSCAMGAAMSYFAFRARDALSATGFTVVGNVCKVMSVLANVILWDRHATPAGLVGLMVCMAGSACYRAAPLRESVKTVAGSSLEASVKTPQQRQAQKS